MNNNYLLIIMFLIICFVPRFASSSPISECYKEFDTKADVSQCMDLKLKKAEESLGNVVSIVRKKMEEKSINSNQIYPIRSFNLSQQSYLIYRKTNCNWHFDKSFPNTESSELLKNCLITMTLDRILELENITDSPTIKKTDSSSQKINKQKNKKYKNTNKVNEDRPDEKTTESNMDNAVNDRYDEVVELDEECYFKPDPGNCGEFIMKYFYYSDGANCSSFIWSGCGGLVPFETMEDCRNTCM